MSKKEGQEDYRRYYQIGGITAEVETDVPMTETTFKPKFELFRVDGPGEDTITIRHHSYLLDLDGQNLGQEVYRRPPWIIYKRENSWLYLCVSGAADKYTYCIAVFNQDYSEGDIYSPGEEPFRRGNLGALTRFPTDQILFAQLLADRDGCYIHSGGVILDGKGLLFVGHSDAGKSTMVTLLKNKATILCDDRVIMRRWPDGFKVHGTWSHGDIPEVSADSAPLRAIMFLEQARANRLMPIDDRKEIIKRLLACLIKPLVTTDWWQNTLAFIEKAAREVPCYTIQFDKSGQVLDLLERL
jgi:hypothetical protein